MTAAEFRAVAAKLRKGSAELAALDDQVNALIQRFEKLLEDVKVAIEIPLPGEEGATFGWRKHDGAWCLLVVLPGDKRTPFLKASRILRARAAELVEALFVAAPTQLDAMIEHREEAIKKGADLLKRLGDA